MASLHAAAHLCQSAAAHFVSVVVYTALSAPKYNLRHCPGWYEQASDMSSWHSVDALGLMVWQDKLGLECAPTNIMHAKRIVCKFIAPAHRMPAGANGPSGPLIAGNGSTPTDQKSRTQLGTHNVK